MVWPRLERGGELKTISHGLKETPHKTNLKICIIFLLHNSANI